jgi:hypothetical protein
MIKLNKKTTHPKENGIYLAIINGPKRFGIVGAVSFLDGQWNSPHPELAWAFEGNDFDFFWIEFNHQPERSKREDSQNCEMRCSEHCSNAVRDK